MQKTLWILGLVAALLAGNLVFAQTPSEVAKCDAIYAQRGSTLLEAAHCYLGQKQYERSLIALSALFNTSAKTPDERKSIQLAAKILAEMKITLESTATYKYWDAVWISFDAIEQDRGALMPRHMFKNLKTIQSQLRQAIELDPTTHFYGPHRVLGMMHTQMPGIVGGDKRLAENLLKVAYDQAPRFSANAYGYANILYVNGKTSEAKAVLTRFLAMTDEELNPYPGQPMLALIPETAADRQKAKELLADINGGR